MSSEDHIESVNVPDGKNCVQDNESEEKGFKDAEKSTLGLYESEAETAAKSSQNSNNFLLLSSLLLTFLDHLSQIPILASLWRQDQHLIFWIGLAIHFLPGPLAAYQFFLLGYGWRSLILLCHPLNPYLHSLLHLTRCSSWSGFVGLSAKIVAYSRDCQGLLESPMQAIFTLTLICIRVLPTPIESAQDSHSWTVKNSHGDEINLSFLPLLSVLISFLCIVINGGRAMTLVGHPWNRMKQNLSWVLFLASTVLFRVQVWTLLAAFLAEFVFIVLCIILCLNFAVLITSQSSIQIDPVISSVFCLAFPVTHLKSVLTDRGLKLDHSMAKFLNKVLTASGNMALLGCFWIVMGCVEHRTMRYSTSILVRRDVIVPFIVSTTLLGFLSMLSTFVISVHEIKKSLLACPMPGPCLREVLAYAVRSLLLGALFLIFIYPFTVDRLEQPLTLKINDVCGSKVNFTFHAYKRGGSLDHEDENLIWKCKNDENVISSLGCTGKDLFVFEDQFPASSLHGFIHDKPLILLKPGASVEELGNIVLETCAKEVKIVCYFTNFGTLGKPPNDFQHQNINPALCTHIVYAFAKIQPETLLIAPSDETVDIIRGLYDQVTSLKHQKLKIMLGLTGSDGSPEDSPYARLVRNQTARSDFVSQAVDFLVQHNFDGLDLDWLWPRCWDLSSNECRGPESEREGFSMLIEELAEAFESLNLTLSALVSAIPAQVEQAYNVSALSKHLDFINLRSYVYNSNAPNKAMLADPLYGNDTDCLNVNCGVKFWLSKGMEKRKIVVGMQFYAQTYTLSSKSETTIGSPTTGVGKPGSILGRGGVFSYYELCSQLPTENGWQVFPNATHGSYAVKDDQWISFDDVASVREKTKYIEDMGLGGALFWALEYDDFRNTCKCEDFPLLRAINRVLGRLDSKDPGCSVQTRV